MSLRAKLAQWEGPRIARVEHAGEFKLELANAEESEAIERMVSVQDADNARTPNDSERWNAIDPCA